MIRTRHPAPLIALLLLALTACAAKELRVTEFKVFGGWPPREGVIALRGCEGRIADTHIHCFVGAMLYTDWKPLGDGRKGLAATGPSEDYTHAVLVKHRAETDIDCGSSYHGRSGSPDQGLSTWEVRVGDEAVVVRYLVTREPPLDTVDIGGKGYDLGTGRLFLIDLTTDPPEVRQEPDEGFFIMSLIHGTPVVGSTIDRKREVEGPAPCPLLANPETFQAAIEKVCEADPDVENWLDL